MGSGSKGRGLVDVSFCFDNTRLSLEETRHVTPRRFPANSASEDESREAFKSPRRKRPLSRPHGEAKLPLQLLHQVSAAGVEAEAEAESFPHRGGPAFCRGQVQLLSQGASQRSPGAQESEGCGQEQPQTCEARLQKAVR